MGAVAYGLFGGAPCTPSRFQRRTRPAPSWQLRFKAPTFIGTDNTANQRVASGAAVPSRSKHFLRRYHVLLQRVRSQEITIGHVPDRAMPADFLTKWIGASKLNVSVEHVTNSRHAPKRPTEQ